MGDEDEPDNNRCVDYSARCEVGIFQQILGDLERAREQLTRPISELNRRPSQLLQWGRPEGSEAPWYVRLGRLIEKKNDEGLDDDEQAEFQRLYARLEKEWANRFRKDETDNDST